VKKGGSKTVDPIPFNPQVVRCRNLQKPVVLLDGSVIEAVVPCNGVMKLKLQGQEALVDFGRLSHLLSSEQNRMMRRVCLGQQSG